MPNVNSVNAPPPPRANGPRAALLTLVMRLHFYIGLFVGPFIFIAALTGTLYVLTPQLENRLYAHQLYVDKPGIAQPLAAQIAAAQASLATGNAIAPASAARLVAVRPAPTQRDTTRVMFSHPSLGPSQSHAVFIDPATLEVQGQLTVYGTSGILPFRTWLDRLHQGLLLGSAGRIYSELAASWLWVAAVGGLSIWWMTRARTRYRPTRGKTAQKLRLRRRHAAAGLTLLAGMLFFSATGLTWSQWAGGNIAVWRSALGWQTTVVNTALTDTHTASPHDEHAEHQGHMGHHSPTMALAPLATFDGVIDAARAAGISAGKLEIRPAKSANQAWSVTEIERRWPTQADAVAVNPVTFAVTDRVRFADYPLAAKLTRWGVDAHMGILFGLANQLVLAAFGLGLCLMIVWGYRLWWIRRIRLQGIPHPAQTLWAAFVMVPLAARVLISAVALVLALCLPVMGISLLVFLAIDLLRWHRHHATPSADQQAA